MRSRMMLIIACAAALVACSDDDNDGEPGNSTGNDSVTVVNDAFDPVNVTADSASTVVWTWNSGGTVHNVTFENAITGSGDKSSGTFSQTFPGPGTYPYRCTHHSSSFTSGEMRGTVIVE